MKWKFFIPTIMFLLLMACKKELAPLPTELPPITEEGKNTFGCMIGDEVYVPEIRRTSWSIPGPQSEPIVFSFLQFPDYFFRVSTIRLVDKDDDLMDAIVDFSAYLPKSKIGEYQFSHMVVKHENVYYYMDTTSSNLLSVARCDTINGIISGTFYCTLIDKDSSNSKIINITNGRFDLKNQ